MSVRRVSWPSPLADAIEQLDLELVFQIGQRAAHGGL
jgi:hypothetical protein